MFLSGIFGFLAVELGWITTEEGRQPWIAYNLMRVSSAVTPDQWMLVSFIIFSIIYIFLGVTLVSLLLLIARRRKENESWSEFIVSEPQRAPVLEAVR